MSEISETEIRSMTKEQNYMRGYKDGKSDVLDKIRDEIRNEQNMDYKCHRKTYDNCLRIIDKYKEEV